MELFAEELYHLEGGVLGEHVLTHSFTALGERERKADPLFHTHFSDMNAESLLHSYSFNIIIQSKFE